CGKRPPRGGAGQTPGTAVRTLARRGLHRCRQPGGDGMGEGTGRHLQRGCRIRLPHGRPRAARLGAEPLVGATVAVHRPVPRRGRPPAGPQPPAQPLRPGGRGRRGHRARPVLRLRTGPPGDADGGLLLRRPDRRGDV
ncbi:uncharacterized protein METZ01_LOCUS516174, partial [marine metagenome]